MNSRFLIWALILIVLAGGVLGLRTSSKLRSYQENAHNHFVNDFRNGVISVGNQVLGAQRSLAQGDSMGAAQALNQIPQWFTVVRSAAGGMSIKLGDSPWDLLVISTYQNEAVSLSQELVHHGRSAEVDARLDSLAHDLQLLSNLFGKDEDESWLQQANAAELKGRYLTWRSQARITTDLER